MYIHINIYIYRERERVICIDIIDRRAAEVERLAEAPPARGRLEGDLIHAYVCMYVCMYA